MSRRRSTVSLLVSQLDNRIKDKILNMNVDKERLKKFDEIEKKEVVAELTDLRDLDNKSENEVLKTLNLMFKNKQFFMYCGPLLININPGPNHIEDYLNLEKWILENTSLPETERKPHLYAFIDYIYESLVKENKDQVVNLLGQIGSGKTFNLVHILEYLCYFHAPEKKQMEFFDTIHKSMQLVHLLGSIFRQNNIESSSCGMLLKIGFDENNKICNFDLNANILDFTLPFSENGRSFSILHSLMTGATPEIKRVLDLPERESSLNFFRKFTKQFDKNTKERFKLNDYEIWTRFHSLLSTFEFTKIEIIEILQLLSFVLICNEASIGKKRSKNGEDYVLNKGHSSKKLAKNFCLNEEEFIKIFGAHKTLSDMKNTLISLMKHTYFVLFEFVKTKIKNYLNNFFAPYKPIKRRASLNVSNVNNNNNNDKKIKYLYFIDIPGEVNDQTLGGLVTNLANECQNLYAGSHYMSVVEKLYNEQLNIKYFQPLHSLAVVESILGKDGLLTYLSRPFTEKNYKRLQTKVKRKEHYEKCCKFSENIQNSNTKETEYDFFFDFKFSQRNITFNYEALYLESKSVLLTQKVLKLFEASGNSIIKSQLKYLYDSPNNLLGITLKTLNNLFSPLENLNPFVIYCLHSNNSLKLFFGNKDTPQNKLAYNKYNYDSVDFEVPLKNTFEILRNGLVVPVLYWEWFGFHEWLDVELFVNEFSEKFQKLQSNIFKNPNTVNSKDPNSQNNAKTNNYLKGAFAPLKDLQKENVDLKKLNPFEAATYMLSVLCAPRNYIIGSQHVLFRKDALNKARELLTKILEIQENENLNMLMGGNPKTFNRRLTALNINGNKRNSGINSRLGIPVGNHLVANMNNNNANNNENKNVKQRYNKNSIFNRYAERKMNSIINNTKSNNELNTTRNRGGSYSRSQSINDTFNRNPTLNTEMDNNLKNIYDNNNNEENNLNKDNGEVNKKFMRRKSMKIQCHLEIININPNNIGSNGSGLGGSDSKAILEAKNHLGLNLNIDAKKVNFKFDNGSENNNQNVVIESNKSPNGKLSLFNFLSMKKADDFHNESIENTHTTYLENEFEIYKKQNNVIIPKSKYFNALKNLFDPKNVENYAIFDYTENLNEVKLIQNNWRAYKSRMLYKVFRYCCRNIVIVQRYIRGWVIRRKFRKFKLALRCINKIQKFYRKRHQLRVYYATKIQSLLRMKMSRIYYMNKLARKEIGEDSDEEMRKEEEANKINNEPEFIYETQYEYEEVEETDEESDNEENSLNNNDDNNNEESINNEGDLNQNNISFSVDNSNNVSVNIPGNNDREDNSSKKPNPIKAIGNLKDKSANLNIKLNPGNANSSGPNLNIKMKSTMKASKSNNKNNVKENNNKVASNKNIKDAKETKETKEIKEIKEPKEKPKKKVNKEKKENNGEKKVKKKKKVMKLVKKTKLVPNPKAKSYEKANQKKFMDRALHFADMISSGFTEKYLRKKKGKKVEKKLHDVSVSMVDRKKSMVDQSSIIGRKWYFNNLSLIQEMEVDKDKRQILDILMKTQAVKGLDNSLNHLKDDYGIIKNALNTKTPAKKPPKGKKIEDRLIEYGELVKLKKVGKKMEIMKTEEQKMPFKPIMQTTKMDISLFEKSNMIEKSSLYHVTKEEKIEQLKQKHQIKEEDYEFRPRINSVSKNINRKLNDLYHWKDKIDYERNVKAKQQMINEEKEILKHMNFTPNKVSQQMNKKNNYSNFKKNANRSQDDIIVHNEDDVEFDLWPDIKKTYAAN